MKPPSGPAQRACTDMATAGPRRPTAGHRAGGHLLSLCPSLCCHRSLCQLPPLPAQPLRAAPSRPRTAYARTAPGRANGRAGWSCGCRRRCACAGRPGMRGGRRARGAGGSGGRRLPRRALPARRQVPAGLRGALRHLCWSKALAGCSASSAGLRGAGGQGGPAVEEGSLVARRLRRLDLAAGPSSCRCLVPPWRFARLCFPL